MQMFKGKSGGILAGLAAGALWGLVFVAPRMVSGETAVSAGFSSVDLTAGRFLSYGFMAALLILIGWRSKKLPNLNQAIAALGLSLLGFTGYYLLLVLAIKDAGTEMPTLIIGTIPIWVMLLGFLGNPLSKQQGLSFRSLLPGLLLTAGGLMMMGYTQLNGQPVTESIFSTHYWRGIAYALIAMVCWTLFAIWNAAWLKKHPEVSATDWANWLGVATSMGALLLWLWAGTSWKVMATEPTFTSFAFICIATGLGSAWLATILWNIASQRLSASLCGQLIVSETVFALVYSAWWDGKMPALLAVAASVLFVLGILASIKAHR